MEILKSIKKFKLGFFFMVLFLLINLVTLSEYGITWDELDHHFIGDNNLRFLKSEINGTGLLSEFELHRSMIYYGPFFYTIQSLSSEFFIQSFQLNYVDSHHAPIVIIASLGVLCTYIFSFILFDKKVALFATLFLIFFPRFIAHAHYNSGDIPVMIFLTITLLFLYLTFKFEKVSYAILSGILAGITISTKTNGLIIFPIFFASYGVYVLFDLTIFKNLKKFRFKKIIIVLSTFLLCALVSLFIFWPTLRFNPKIFLESIIYGLNIRACSGDAIHLSSYTIMNDPCPAGFETSRYYPPIYVMIVTPTIILYGLIVGIFFSIKNILKKKKIFEYSLILFWFLIPLLFDMKPNLRHYDGIRHLFIIIPALAILAALGVKQTIQKLSIYVRSKKTKKNIFLIITSLLIIVLFINVYQIHPYEGSFFNVIVRLIMPQHLEYYFDIEYWGATYRQGTEWLVNNTAENSVICVPIAGHLVKHYLETDLIRNDLILLGSHLSDYCDKLISYPNNDKYVMFFTRYKLHVDNPLKHYEPVFKISRYNSDLLYIYKIDNSNLLDISEKLKPKLLTD